jgi:hypothetical protein
MSTALAQLRRGAAQSGVKVFVSYSRKDTAFVDRLEAVFRGHGIEPLIDRSEICVFEDWWKRIESLIASADTVVFVISPDSVVSEVTRKEVTLATSLNKRLAPVVYRPVEYDAILNTLRHLQFLYFDEETKFEASANQLVEALRSNIEWVRKHTEFGEAALRWNAAHRSTGLLLRSPVLEEAERWIAAPPPGAPAPTEQTRAFIAESRRAATQRRNILTGGLAAGLVVALGLAGIANRQRGIAQLNVMQRRSN